MSRRIYVAVTGANEAWAGHTGPGRGNPTGEEAGQFQANCEVLFRCCPGLAASLPLSSGSLGGGWGGLGILKACWHTAHIKYTSDSLVLPCMYPSRPHTCAAPPTHGKLLPQASVTNASHAPPPPCTPAHRSRPGGRSWGFLSSPGSSRSLGQPAPALGTHHPTPQKTGSKKYFKSQAETWKMSCLSVWIKVCVSVSPVFF